MAPSAADELRQAVKQVLASIEQEREASTAPVTPPNNPPLATQ
jgi:hypothetical protein